MLPNWIPGAVAILVQLLVLGGVIVGIMDLMGKKKSKKPKEEQWLQSQDPDWEPEKE